MNIRLLICGTLGGMLGTFTLSMPLYLVLPSGYSSEWLEPFAPWSIWRWVGYLLSLGVGIGTGYVAARWCWAASTRDRITNGVVAGLLASMVAFPLIGAPAGGLAGNRLVFLNGTQTPDPADENREAIHIVCETAIDVTWKTYLTFCVLVLGSASLGGLGGWIYAKQQAKGWGDAGPGIWAEPIDATLAIQVMTGMQLLLCVAAVSALRTNVERSVAKYGFQPGFPPAGILDWPVAMNLLVLTVAAWFSGRASHRHWHHPVGGARRAARISLMTMLGLPIGVGLVLLFLSRGLFLDPIFLLGALAWIGVTAYWYVKIQRGPIPATPTKGSSLPSFRDRLLINGGLLGVLAPAVAMLGGVSTALSLALGAVKFLGVLLPGKEGLASPVLPSVPASMQNIFASHYVCSIYIAGGWIVLALIHAGAVLLWQRYQARRRAATAVQAAGRG